MLLGVLSGCAIGTPFKGPGYQSGKVTTVTEDDQVLVGLTYVKVGDDRDKNAIFWDHVDRVHKSMEQHDGLIGHVVRRQIFGKKGWTMSVWKDEASLNRFVRSDVHQEAIQSGMPALVETRFARLVVHKDEIPISWSKAEKALEAQGGAY